MNTYPKYYRKHGRCIRRNDETTGLEVIIPDDEKHKLPLVMSEVTLPSADRFDEHIKNWEEVDLECFEHYIYGFIGRVERDISAPMTKRSIEKQLQQTQSMKK